VDEISQVVVPVVDGGRGIATMFDIPGDPPPKAAAALRLRSHRRLPGGVTWVRYRVRA
jgi:riboflavin biosynthesis pyrimidine reductase